MKLPLLNIISAFGCRAACRHASGDSEEGPYDAGFGFVV